MLTRVVDYVRANPVKVRGAVVALLTLVGVAVPGLAGIETNELVVGAVLSGVAYLLSLDAGKRTQLKPAQRREAVNASEPDGGYEGDHR